MTGCDTCTQVIDRDHLEILPVVAGLEVAGRIELQVMGA